MIAARRRGGADRQVGGLLLAWTGLLTVAAAYLVLGGVGGIACLGWVLARQLPLKLAPSRFAPDGGHPWPFARWAVATFVVGISTPFVVPWVVMAPRDEAVMGLLAATTTGVPFPEMTVEGIVSSPAVGDPHQGGF